MLKITADVFSGRPNPTWIVEDLDEIRAVLSDVAKVAGSASARAAEEGKLGELRGFYVDVASDQLAARNLSTTLRHRRSLFTEQSLRSRVEGVD